MQITLTGDPAQFVGVLLAIAAAPELAVETELTFLLRGEGEGKEPPEELAFAELLVAQLPVVPLTLDDILPLSVEELLLQLYAVARFGDGIRNKSIPTMEIVIAIVQIVLFM